MLLYRQAALFADLLRFPERRPPIALRTHALSVSEFDGSRVFVNRVEQRKMMLGYTFEDHVRKGCAIPFADSGPRDRVLIIIAPCEHEHDRL